MYTTNYKNNVKNKIRIEFFLMRCEMLVITSTINTERVPSPVLSRPHIIVKKYIQSGQILDIVILFKYLFLLYIYYNTYCAFVLQDCACVSSRRSDIIYNIYT